VPDLSSPTFRIGVTPDFYIDAKGRFEAALEEKLAHPGIQWGPMPDLPGNAATPHALNQFDGIFALATHFTAEGLRGVERLAIVARWGVGYDRIDVAALTGADVMLAITPNAVRTPVAESIFTLILALAKNLLIQDRITRDGKWRGDLPRMGWNLRGKVLGSIGCGNIGREMFRLARPFGFSRLLAYDPYVRPEVLEELGVEAASKDTVFQESDFVAVNSLLNEETRGSIGEEDFRRMKPTAYFINTARGPIVRERELVRALEKGWIAGAGLDVFEQEPPPKDHPLFAMNNVVVTPHGLPWTADLVRDNGVEACDNLLRIARGELPDSIVNREVTGRPGFQRKLRRYREAWKAGGWAG
jgi:phosphoglycerate dehydrogenase-like enzyme